jgi:paraquat-inducible protein A
MTLGGRRFLLGCAIVAASVCLALSINLPFIALAKPVFFAHGHSLVSAVNALVRSNQLVLAGLILLFAILLPLLKLLYLILLAALPRAEVSRSAEQLRSLDWLGRWSLHDILAILLMLALVASEEAFALRAAAGAYFFLAAVLFMVLASTWLHADTSAARTLLPATRARHALATRGPTFGALISLAVVTFALGVTLPVIHLSDALGDSDLHSLLTVVWALLTHGEHAAWVAILALAIVLPGLRLLALATCALARVLPQGVRARAVWAAEMLGGYATADTMVLTLMLFFLVASGYAHAQLEPGAYCLAASAVLTMLAFAWINIISPAIGAQASSLTARLAGLVSAGTGGRS